jgi:hypothetical protein
MRIKKRDIVEGSDITKAKNDANQLTNFAKQTASELESIGMDKDSAMEVSADIVSASIDNSDDEIDESLTPRMTKDKLIETIMINSLPEKKIRKVLKTIKIKNLK